jgi:CRP/FNR family transcriptional regulator, anaerobic regulatory protein
LLTKVPDGKQPSNGKIAPGSKSSSPIKVPCVECPLRRLPIFENENREELDFIQSFKVSEITIARGSAIYPEGTNSPYLYTVLDGWAFRYKSLPDGRRQIVSYALAGDFIGLQGAMQQAIEYGVEALTDVRLCVFPRDKLFTLFASHPSLGFNLTWLGSREERFLDDNLLALGRRTALERVAFFIAHIFQRAKELQLVKAGTLQMPITQLHLADTLGLSLVHLNKTLKRLRATGLISLEGRYIKVNDAAGLSALGKLESPPREKRPLI